MHVRAARPAWVWPVPLARSVPRAHVEGAQCLQRRYLLLLPRSAERDTGLGPVTASHRRAQAFTSGDADGNLNTVDRL